MLQKHNPMAPSIARYAEGGDVEPLLAPPGMGMSEEIPVEQTTGGDPLLPLAEILGPDKANEMYEAISVYPVVEEVATPEAPAKEVKTEEAPASEVVEEAPAAEATEEAPAAEAVEEAPAAEATTEESPSDDKEEEKGEEEEKKDE